jgi:tripartite-type tricarboxylate transporter receptor subunit TctC
MFKKWVAGMAMVGSMMCAAQALAAYPERNIQAVIPWGAGGATDSIARGLTPLVEKALDTRLVLTNRPGGTGLIGTNYVMQQRADGYTMLYGAENPQLYQLLGIADFDYDALHPINIIGQNRAVIAVPPDSPFKTMRELVDHAKAHPGELRMGVVGAGGLPSTVFAMIDAVEDLDVPCADPPADPVRSSACAGRVRQGRGGGVAGRGADHRCAAGYGAVPAVGFVLGRFRAQGCAGGGQAVA